MHDCAAICHVHVQLQIANMVIIKHKKGDRCSKNLMPGSCTVRLARTITLIHAAILEIKRSIIIIIGLIQLINKIACKSI